MNLYPAIDILEGNAVRLTRGEFDAKKVYDRDPLAAARAWVQEGARQLHVVDLDGARTGHPVNLDRLRQITAELDIPVQYGGGLRSLRAIAHALDAGAHRAILGTAALTDPGLLDAALQQHGPERLLVSVDVRAGLVATAGWQETTALTAPEAIAWLRELGVGELVYTNVDRDGLLAGPDLGVVAEVAAAAGERLIYSGGIATLDDLARLAGLPAGSGLSGVIVGKALYERRFTIAQAHAALGAPAR